MKKVFTHTDFSRVGHYQAVLEEKGIKTFVNKMDSSALGGGIPYSESWPELCVVDDSDFEEAMKTIEEVNASLDVKIESWNCPKCKEEIEEGFGECWNCGTLKEVKS
jgi:hypothetical protein